MTRGLRHDAFQSLAALMRPLNDALKELGIALDAKRAEGKRVVFGPITLVLNVGGTTLPVRIGVPLNGTVQALYIARVMPNDPNETPSVLGLPYWTTDPDGKVVLRSLPGLTNGKTYRLYFEAVMQS